MRAVTAWRSVESQDALAWAVWDGDFIIYHRPSGKTHFANGATAELLTRILLEPKTAAAAADELAAGQQALGDADFQSGVAALLERLEHLGLVERRDG